MEFATMYAGFGSKVTLLETGSRFMPKADRDIAESMLESLKRKGIEIRLNAYALSVYDTADGITFDLYGQFRQYPLFLGRRRTAACHRTQTDDRRPQTCTQPAYGPTPGELSSSMNIFRPPPRIYGLWET